MDNTEEKHQNQDTEEKHQTSRQSFAFSYLVNQEDQSSLTLSAKKNLPARLISIFILFFTLFLLNIFYFSNRIANRIAVSLFTDCCYVRRKEKSVKKSLPVAKF